MSDAAIERLDAGTLCIAALRGWIAGVLFGTLILGIYNIGLLAESSPPADEFLRRIVTLPLVAIVIVPIGATLALPAPILAVLLLWPADGFARQTRHLPVWLAVGFIASLPTAYFVWAVMTGLVFHDDMRMPAAYSWDSIGLPLLVLACGLVGAFFGWRTKGKLTE